MHITNINLDEELHDAFSNNEKILTDFEKSELLMHGNEMEISISPIYDGISEDRVNQITFVKSMSPEVTMQEIESGLDCLLTSQKRQPLEGEHIETPSKRKRLRFEDEPDVDKVVTPPIPETTVVSTLTADHPLGLSQHLELVQNSPLLIEKKLQKKKVFADKNTKLGQKTIRKWLNNINAHTVPSTIPNVYMPTSEILFKAPSTSFTSRDPRKWNNSLNALIHMHNVAISEQKAMPMEYGESLEKSTEFTRFEDGSNKTYELFSELSSALGKSVELSKNVTSEKSITIAMDELPQVPKVHDILESITDVPEVIQSPEITEDTLIPDTSHNSSKSLSSCLITKRELLVLLEIIWQNTDCATFNDIVSPDHYSKLDASSCFSFLLDALSMGSYH